MSVLSVASVLLLEKPAERAERVICVLLLLRRAAGRNEAAEF
jgi:hypothetical protein